MKKYIVVLSGLILVLGTRMQAQTVDPAAALANLRQALEKSVTVNQLDSQKAKSVFVMALPGVPYDPTAKPDPDTGDAETLADVLNAVPIGDKTAQTTGTTINGVYGKILDDKILLKPPTPPSADAKAKRDEAEQAYEVISKEYEDRSNAYFDTVMATAEALAEGASATKINILKKKEELALNKLAPVRKSYYAAFQRYMDATKAVEGDNAIWGARLSKFNQAEIRNYPVATWPSYKSWPDNAGWITITFDSEKLFKSTSVSESDKSAGGGFLFWSAKGNKSEKQEFNSTDIQSMTISMDVKRVRLFRRWMDSLVYYVHDWTWDNPEMVSTGTRDEHGAYTGLMPLIPTDLILVRNVAIGLKLDNSQVENMRRISGVSGGASFLGFSVGGSYSGKNSSGTQKVEVTTAGIKIPDVQIIGYYCEALPACPVPAAPQP